MQAIFTMSDWDVSPEREEELTWRPLTANGLPMLFSVDEMEFTLNLPWAWDVMSEPREAAKKRITKAFKRSLDEWLASREQLGRERGAPKLPRKRKEDRHLRWLVWYQVGKETYPDIARHEKRRDLSNRNMGRKTVESGVASAAELIDLKLRPPDRPGPKRSRRDSR